MFEPIHELFCVLPIYYRPMTVMLVDDDPDFLKALSDQLSDQYPVVTFTDPDKAILYFEQRNAELFEKWKQRGSSDLDDLVQHARQEIYNPDRFKQILVSVIDYDMPNKNGFDVMSTMGQPIMREMSSHSYILLTGKKLSDMDKKTKKKLTDNDFISKWDSDFLSQLLIRIHKKLTGTFQWMSYEPARQLTLDSTEKTNFLFDGNFLPILNDHIEKHHVCEIYIFDKQGSFLFLDKHGNLSWLFIRSDLGMSNTISLAQKYHAPKWVIDALWSKEKLLTLYEEKDFERIKTIDWEQYVLPATVFKDDNRYLEFFHLSPHSDYYYVFTDKFPNHGIDQAKIVSYKRYIDSLE